MIDMFPYGTDARLDIQEDHKKCVQATPGPYAAIPYTMRRVSAEVEIKDLIEVGGVDVKKFEACCRECPHGGERWSCPPFSYDPMSIWNAHDRMHVMGRVYEKDADEPDATLDEAAAFLTAQKRDLLAEVLRRERATEGSFALAAGMCSLCEECTRPSGGACRHHEKMRPSIEAIGGDVGMIAKDYLDLDIMWGRDGIAPPRLMLICALLV